jgi:hypothetical protein
MTVQHSPAESAPVSDTADAVEATKVLLQAWSLSGSLRRRRTGRGAVMAWIRAEVGRGAGVPDADAIARHFGWLTTSARDALLGLVADGLLRVESREPPHGKAVYALTAAGASAASKPCRSCRTRKPPASYWPSRYTPDGLNDICRACTDAAKRAGRNRQGAQRAARVAAP